MTTRPSQVFSSNENRNTAITQDLVRHVYEICDRVEQREPELQALVPEPARRTRLEADAALLERRYQGTRERPPLYGTLIGVKDVFHVEGLPTRAGSRLPVETLHGKESSVITRLRSKGALFLGKTAMDEFAHADPAPTCNPHDGRYTPGGSSAGSAAAVAAGYCPVAICSQTTGSTVVPASFCGVAGFAATHARIELGEVIHLSPSLDTFGAIATDMATLSWFVRCLTDGDAQPSDRGILAVAEELAQFVAPEILQLLQCSVALLSKSGLTVQPFPLSSIIELPRVYEQTQYLMFGEMARQHAARFRDHGAVYGPAAAEAVRAGQNVSDAVLEAASLFKAETTETLSRFMIANGIAAWILPTYAEPVPRLGEAKQLPPMTVPWAFAAMPMVNIPAARTNNGMPFGLLLAGVHMRDQQLLMLATEIEQILGLNSALP